MTKSWKKWQKNLFRGGKTMFGITKEITWLTPSETLKITSTVIVTLVASTIIISSLDFIFGLGVKFIIERFM